MKELNNGFTQSKVGKIKLEIHPTRSAAGEAAAGGNDAIVEHRGRNSGAGAAGAADAGDGGAEGYGDLRGRSPVSS